MRRSSRAGIAAIAVALCCVLAAPAAAAPTLPIGHHGRWITDAAGRVVILHGHNMVYKRPPYLPSVTGFSEDDARFLAEEGYNTIRVGIIYAAVEPTPGTYDEAYLTDIGNTVEMLGRHGILSQLDFHQDLYNERFSGEGWPDWAVQDDGLPNQPDFGFPGNYVGMPALWRAFDHFWNNDPGPGGIGLQDRYAAAWRHVARRFRDSPYIIGYDLMNEPWPGSQWPTCANNFGCPVFDGIMTEFIKRMIKAIRRVDRRNLIWYEPNVIFNDGADTQVGDVGDARAGFSFHDYCLPQGFSQQDPLRSCDVFDDLVFANAVRRGKKFGDALLLTEFGATDDLDTMRAMVERADENMIPWQHWHYCACDDPTTSGPGATQAIVIDPAEPLAGENLKRAKLRVLSRAYPQVIAGTPRSFAFDQDTRVFTMRYATTSVGAGTFPLDQRTKIALPRRQYPGGYSVDVHGARVRSQPGEIFLRLTNCPGIHDVTVTVTPGGNSVTQSC